MAQTYYNIKKNLFILSFFKKVFLTLCPFCPHKVCYEIHVVYIKSCRKKADLLILLVMWPSWWQGSQGRITGVINPIYLLNHDTALKPRWLDLQYLVQPRGPIEFLCEHPKPWHKLHYVYVKTLSQSLKKWTNAHE